MSFITSTVNIQGHFLMVLRKLLNSHFNLNLTGGNLYDFLNRSSGSDRECLHYEMQYIVQN